MNLKACLLLATLAGCVVQTETVPGPEGSKGDRGEPGEPGVPGDSVWAQGDGFISYDGNVGIGVTDPVVALDVRAPDVASDVFMSIANSDASSFLALYPGRAQNPRSAIYWREGGDLVLGTAADQFGGTFTNHLRIDTATDRILAKGTFTNMGGPDLAENITAADAAIGPGDVVAADAHGDERIVLAAGRHSGAVLGVISTSPGILLNGDAADLEPGRARDPLQRALALAGRVPVKVTLEGGPIRPGDPLTTSSTPGHAMRATEPWHGGLIGTALTAFDGRDDNGSSATTGKVVVFVTLDKTPSCDSEVQTRLASKVGELEGKLAAEREARISLEARLKALELAMKRPAVTR